MLLVELFALPGAGKTTIADLAANQLSVTTRKGLSEAWTNNSARQRTAYVVRALASFDQLAAASRFAFRARIATGESVFRLARLLAKRDWLRSQSGVILLDQGFLQELWSILVSGKSERAGTSHLSPLIRSLYDGIDVRIGFVQVDPATAASRVRNRPDGDSRFDGLPDDDLSSSLVSASVLQYQIVHAAKAAGLPVHTLDGLSRPELIAAELRSLLSTELPPSGGDQSGRAPCRISVVGSSGSGKTYLARALADRLNLPVYELDELRRSEDGSELSPQAFVDRVADVTARDEWIIDGHYRDVRHLVWSRAEVAIWLNYPLKVVGNRLLGRFRQKRTPTDAVLARYEDHVVVGSKRPRGATWARRLTRIARTLRERREYGRILRSPKYTNLRVVELTSIRMTEGWLRDL